MSRISNPDVPNRIELPSSPAIYLRGVVYATRPEAPSPSTVVFREEEFTPTRGATLPSFQDF